MRPTNEELFALTKLFPGAEPVDIAVAASAREASVIERTFTDGGGFSTIKFASPLPPTDGSLQRDWNFSHRDLEYGGSFMAALVYPDVIELEFVAHVESWPTGFDPNAFLESE